VKEASAIRTSWTISDGGRALHVPREKKLSRQHLVAETRELFPQEESTCPTKSMEARPVLWWYIRSTDEVIGTGR